MVCGERFLNVAEKQPHFSNKSTSLSTEERAVYTSGQRFMAAALRITAAVSGVSPMASI